MGIKDLAKLGFERDRLRDKAATELSQSPATARQPMRQAATIAPLNAAGLRDRERAAVEHHGAATADVPSEWLDGASQLRSMPPPDSVDDRRWHQLIADTTRFLESGWAAKAWALGWSAVDLWGCHPRRPVQRLDLAGALWLLGGSEITAISESAMAIHKAHSALAIYRRPPQSREPACLAWELADAPEPPAAA